MSRFNEKEKTTIKMVNRAGGSAYKQSAKLALVSQMLTSMVNDQYYRSGNQAINDFINLLQQVDPLFTAKAALYARNEFGMRSISHLAAAYIAANVKGQSWTKNFFEKIIHRPDDMLEILALLEKPIPNSVKKGFAKKLETLNEYSLAKYKGNDKKFNLIDVCNLVHPKRTAAINALMTGTLKPAETWEVALTQAGQADGDTEELKNAAWNKLLSEHKLGYMALIRNIRNILSQAPECVDMLCEQLQNKIAIKKSLIFPFAFPVAFEIVRQLTISSVSKNKVLKALANAMELSFDNIPSFDDETLVVADFSGSMGTGMQSCRGKAVLFGIALAKNNNSDFMIFGDKAAYVNYDPTMNILSLTEWFDKLNDYMSKSNAKYNVGHGTNMDSIFQTANKKYKRIVIFSDMQSWKHIRSDNALNSYMNKFNCKPFIYSIDLTGYGDSYFTENNVACIAGFSDKIFDLMKKSEVDKMAMIKTIESYTF